MTRVVDILDISDFRLAGGTSASVGEEIAAQTRAGWSTGIIQLNGPLVARVSAIHSRIRDLIVNGSAALFVGQEPVRATVTVIRHPTVLQHTADQLPPITTEHVVVVANSTMIAPDGSVEYDPQLIDTLIQDRFGVEALWAPLSPLIRHQLSRSAGRLNLTADDWVNVIDADNWNTAYVPPRGDRPVIGRHSRGVAAKWPTTRSELQAAYPTDGSVLVHVLGGAEPARAVLGRRLPDSWKVWKFGGLEPRRFLHGLDVYVYYTDRQWIEAFGRNVLEALAAGVPAVLPPRLEPTFGDAACYAEPAGVQEAVWSLHRDAKLWRQMSERGLQRVYQKYSPEVHRDRLEALTGLHSTTGESVARRATPSSAQSWSAQSWSAKSGPGPSGPEPSPLVRASNAQTGVTGARPTDDRRPRLLLISSNGSGMGHLMRLMAYGRRAEEFEPHVVSLSQGVGAVASLGMEYEYVPSAGALGMSPRRWQPIFTERVGGTLDRIKPSLVVFDGTWPYSGIELLRSSHPGPLWVWSRRGMWRHDRSGEQLEKSGWFDEVIEPGDFASPADTGPTASAEAIRVPPVTLLDHEDLLPRDVARRQLGLPLDGPIALISFSGGAVHDVTSDTAAAIAACRRLGLQICVTRSVVSPYVALPEDVHIVNPIPLAAYQRAFDVAISAAGYNSFHELLRFGTPTLFVPKRNSSLDDQDRRARWAAEQGWARYATAVSESATTEVLSDLLERGQDMVTRVAEMDPGNGAVTAARLLTQLHIGRSS